MNPNPSESLAMPTNYAVPSPSHALTFDQALTQAIECYYQQQNPDQSFSYCQQALSLDSQRPDAWTLLGSLNRARGDYAQAEISYRIAMILMPNYADPYFNMTILFRHLKETQKAIDSAKKTAYLNAAWYKPLTELAAEMQQQNNRPKAIALYEVALQAQPLSLEILSTLGDTYYYHEQIDKAILCYLRIITISPEHAIFYHNLGLPLMGKHDFFKAERAFYHAFVLMPQHSTLNSSLAHCYLVMGDIENALKYYRQSLALDPGNHRANNSMLLALNFSNKLSPQEIFVEHLAWARRYADPLIDEIKVHLNPRSPGKKLRIGYMSGDLWWHVAIHFLEPILLQTDRNRFEVFLYHTSPKEDHITARLKSYHYHWRDVASYTDEALCDKIRDDGIDILVEISGHTQNNRLLVMARKPAPVQISWIGYPNTTGLSVIDYKITDAYFDPPGGFADAINSEKLIRMPHSGWCYRPFQELESSPPLPPAIQKGYVTFGCLNRITKTTEETLALFAKILRAVPNSRLFMRDNPLGNEAYRKKFIKFFNDWGITEDRFEMTERLVYSQYYKSYYHVDVSLDAFPYNGGGTTCDSLWMGVPVISLEGKNFVSRMGVSFLSNVGIPELIAKTQDEYFAIAVRLATDLDYLHMIRQRLVREKILQTPLMDSKTFVKDLEWAYQKIWQRWCEGKPPVTFTVPKAEER